MTMKVVSALDDDLLHVPTSALQNALSEMQKRKKKLAS